jgi:hypothetical protein
MAIEIVSFPIKKMVIFQFVFCMFTRPGKSTSFRRIIRPQSSDSSFESSSGVKLPGWGWLVPPFFRHAQLGVSEVVKVMVCPDDLVAPPRPKCIHDTRGQSQLD